MIAIIDYDAGNVKSVEKALQFLGQEVVLTRDKEILLAADKVILPGVGAFGNAMEKLHRYGLVEVIHEIVKKGNISDYKTQLQEKLQQKGSCEIVYEQVSAEGPVHHCLFEIQVVADGKILGKGKAYSKKEAQQMAAQAALEKLI